MKKLVMLLAVILLCSICSVAFAKTFDDNKVYLSFADAYQVSEADYAIVHHYKGITKEHYFTIIAPRDGTYYIAIKPEYRSEYFKAYDRAQTRLVNKIVSANTMYVYKYEAKQYEKFTFSLGSNGTNCAGTFSICFDNYHVPGLYSEVTKEPTCTEAGERVYPCELCNRPARTEIIPANGGHTGTWKTTKVATCTEAGEKTMECSVCKQTVKEFIPATGHTPGNWVVVEAATTTKEGKQTKSCLICGTVLETKAIPKVVQTTNLTASASSMGSDGTFKVTLGIQNNPGVAYFTIESDAASKGITVESAEAVGGTQGWTVTVGNKVVLYGNSDMTQNGNFLSISMKTASKEETTLSFTVSECYNANEQKVTVSGASVQVKKGGIPGDVNGDGVVDGRDLLRLAKYMAGQDVTIDEKAADLNGDGNVDGRDVLRLAKQLAGM